MKEALEISEDVLRLIERADRPPAVAADRVWDAIESTLDAPPAAPPAPPPATAAARPGPGKLLLAAVPLLLLAGAGGFWLVRSEGQTSKPRASVSTGVIAPKGSGRHGAAGGPDVAEPAPDQVQPARPLEPAVPPPIAVPDDSDAAEAPTEAPPAAKVAKPKAGKKATQALGLEDELALMAKAREALHGGNHKKALRLLAQHANTFKDGVFVEERDFSRVVAACELDDVDKAKRFARQYRKAHPKGALGAKLGETCAGDE